MATEKDEVKTVVATKTTKKITPRKFTDDTVITVISNVNGNLYYRNNNKDEWEWAEYGDEHEMTVRDLKGMKAQQGRFFTDNWVIFDQKDVEVIKHLKLEKSYKDTLFPEDLEELFDKDVKEFGEILANATNNVKSVILGKAREKFESGELSNVHIIRLIEDKLGVTVDVNNPK